MSRNNLWKGAVLPNILKHQKDSDLRSRETLMSNKIWIGLTNRERQTLLQALAVFGPQGKSTKEIDALRTKLTYSPEHPKITVGIYGGQVQWTAGNPFPIRVCDYDGDREDLPDVDERGERCRIWFEPQADENHA